MSRRAGLHDEHKALLKTKDLRWDTVDTVFAPVAVVNEAAGFHTDEWSYLTTQYYYQKMKRNIFLHAPDEIDEASIREWLPAPELGSAGWVGDDGKARYDVGGNNCNGFCEGALAAEVFETLGEFEKGIIAAEADLRNNGLNSAVQIEAGLARARCLAQLGRAADAEQAFEKVISISSGAMFPMWQMLARRDLIVHVLDAAGRREEQMPLLGKFIASLVLPPTEYALTLGASIDPEAAVATYRAQEGA